MTSSANVEVLGVILVLLEGDELLFPFVKYVTRIFIQMYFWLILDRFRPMRIPECIQTFTKVRFAWWNSWDHQRLRFSSQRVLKQPCERWIPVGNVLWLGIFWSKGRDNMAKRTERQVDLLSFFHPVLPRQSLWHSLTSRQINDIHFPFEKLSVYDFVQTYLE